MYDPETAALIRRARAIRGISPEGLPERLTDAFTQLVGHRMTLAASPKVPEATIRALRQMANVYELEAVLSQEPGQRSAAAFVSGTAHRLLADSSIAGSGGGPSGVPLDRTGVAPRLSAGLLFLIAGYFADAAEVCAPLRSKNPSELEESLANAIARFVCGDMQGVLIAALPVVTQADSETEEAIVALWREIFDAVQLLAQRFVAAPSPGRGRVEAAVARLRRVMTASVEPLNIEGVDGPKILSTFAGPHHLAKLLRLAADALDGSAVVDLPPPPKASQEVWGRFAEGLAARRPFLWPNHLKAIAAGFSNPGVSSVLSFSTGAGKSTLTEIKVAAALAMGQKVVFLAPTLALVAQCVETFRRSFPGSTTRDSLISEGFFEAIDEPALPDVAVMTPERCLFLLGLHASAFAGVGLIVFDECHLLHPSAGDQDRRALDAMLCLLGVLEAAPSADVVLLSAMMANAGELSKWLASVTNRETIALDLEWKPTRQARGCVVYESSEIATLDQLLLSARGSQETIGPPKEVSQKLVATVHGLFALKQTWASTACEDYRIVSLLDAPVTLKANPKWQLTANKNIIAAGLGRRLAGLGIKTIIFTQDRRQAESICRDLNEAGTTRSLPPFTPDEQAFVRQAEAEMGSLNHVVMPEGMTAVCHHSLLLPAERHLSESLFRRDGGCAVVVATPTLSQGMNLPAGAVIIAGEQRFDPATQDARRVQAHELLNAAGRAGRAGHAAMGVVIVVPSKIVTFAADKEGRVLSKEWSDLQAGIFAKTDHCLTIDDPIERLLDQLLLVPALEDRNVRYFLNRLPFDDSDSGRTARLLNRSLGAFRAGQRGKTSDFAIKIRQASMLRRRQAASDAAMAWSNRLASSTGISSSVLQGISAFVGSTTPSWTVSECLDRTLHWLFSSEALLQDVLSVERLYKVFRVERRGRIKELRDKFSRCCNLWIAGAPLRDIEAILTRSNNTDLGRCVLARRFTRHLMLELAYAMGLFSQVVRERSSTIESVEALPLGLLVGPSCVRRGYDRPELLALDFATSGEFSRVQIHRIGSLLDIASLDSESSFADIQRIVKGAYETWRGQQPS
jgi:superfamily II DNA/RNA helicase